MSETARKEASRSEVFAMGMAGGMVGAMLLWMLFAIITMCFG